MEGFYHECEPVAKNKLNRIKFLGVIMRPSLRPAPMCFWWPLCLTNFIQFICLGSYIFCKFYKKSLIWSFYVLMHVSPCVVFSYFDRQLVITFSSFCSSYKSNLMITVLFFKLHSWLPTVTARSLFKKKESTV